MTKAIARLSILLAATAISATAASASDDISVSLVLGQRNSGFHEAIACGARAAAKELGVKVNIQAAPTYSASEQIPVLNAVMATSPSAIVLDPTSSTALIAPLMEAAANGAKIVAVDTTLDDPSVLSAVVGTDNESVGRETAKALAKALDGKSGKVAQINSIPAFPPSMPGSRVSKKRSRSIRISPISATSLQVRISRRHSRPTCRS